MLDMSISVRVLLWFVIFAMTAGVGVLLILVLLKLLNILKKVEDIVSSNQKNIDNLMTMLPETVSSINEGVQSVTRTVDNANDTIGYISESVTPKAGGFLEGADGIIDTVKVVGEVVRAAIHYFKKDE